MKPSQRIYQQRDIAQNMMNKYAGFLAERMFITPVNERQSKTHQALLVSHKETYKRWKTISETLTMLGGMASNEEHQERKQKKKEYEKAKYEAESKGHIGEEKTKEVTHNNFNTLIAPAWDQMMNSMLSTTNTVTLNTSLPTTTGTTYTFSIPRFKVAPVEEEVIKGVEINDDTLIYDEVQEFMEEEVEGIV